MKVYCFPGLGFDKRVFEPLQSEIGHLQSFNWIAPNKNEPLSAYAARIAKGLEIDAETVLIGHSLGGMLVQELAAQYPVRKVILLSSIVHESENPWYFKMLAPLHLQYGFSRTLTTSTVSLWGPAHDYKTSEEQKLFSEMVQFNSRAYYHWALRELSIWREPKLSKELLIIRAHGTKDLTFPFKKMQTVDHVIEGGGHFMVYKRAKELSTIIRKEIA